MSQPSWTGRYLFRLSDVLAVAEEAAAADSHHAPQLGSRPAPALWWVQKPVGVEIRSNAVVTDGASVTVAACTDLTHVKDHWLQARTVHTPLLLLEPHTDGAPLLEILREHARKGHSHFVIETGIRNGTPWFGYGVQTVPAPPAPAAPVWWTLADLLRGANLTFTEYAEDGGRWTEVDLSDGTSIVIYATVERESTDQHPQAAFLSWSATWMRHGPHDPSETARVYDSAGQGLGYADDTAALVEAISDYAADYRP